ncbi:MAG: thioredoxin family protein [Deltaproteobacteria bacterium]|nr:thioredoxin family protein [Deltaproteobacteria bacterium]
MAVQSGYTNVFRDPKGYPDWQAAGMPVERSSLEAPGLTESSGAPGTLSGLGIIWTLLGVFLGGIALNLTPCVYPLIPITAAYFGGRSGGGRGQLIVHGSLYIGGLCITNSVLGVIAALSGGLLGAALQNPVVLILVAAILVLFASSLFGLWELRLPSSLTQAASRSYAGYFGSLFMGITLGVVAAPCLGPFVLGLLTWVAGMGSPGIGFLVFFTLSVGLGLPLFFLALFSGLIDKLPRSGQWMVWIRKLMGWVLVAMAVYFIRPLLPETATIFGLSAVSLSAGLHLGWLEKTPSTGRLFGWIRLVTLVIGVSISALWVGGWILQGPGAQWNRYSEEIVAEARETGKPVIIDFYAEWCAPCRELEDAVFRHPEVVDRARKRFVMIKVDLTSSGNAQQEILEESLLDRFEIKGVPTIIFLDAQGKERRDLRLVDFEPPEQFLRRMDRVKESPIPGPENSTKRLTDG